MATEILQDQLALLSFRLKELRRERQWTLDDLARQSGFSKGYLSRLESGDRQASIAAVLTLSRVFGVSVSALFEGDNRERLVIVRGGEASAHKVDGLTCWPLSAKAHPFQIQPMRVVVSPDRDGEERRSHDGEEWLFVISGELTLLVGGESLDLDAGDAAHFDARLPHRLLARNGVEAEVLLVAAPGQGRAWSRPAVSVHPLLSRETPSSSRPAHTIPAQLINHHEPGN
jgi:transcriptional regulator with XRE-family HTH domain